MNNTEKSAHAGHSKSSHFLSDLPLPTRAVWTPLRVQAASSESWILFNHLSGPISSVPNTATLPPSGSSPSHRQVL